MASGETYPLKSRSREALTFYVRYQGNGSGAPIRKDGDDAITITRASSGTYSVATATNLKCPKLLAFHVQPMYNDYANAVAFTAHVTAYDVTNNTATIKTFRLSNSAAYDLATTEELSITVVKKNSAY